MDKKLTYLVIAATAILHNGKRYEKGDKIELTESEAENLSLYVQLDSDEAKKQSAERKAAEEQAEKERLAAEEAEKKAKKSAEKQAKTKAE
ncbi:hypothetical protein [Pasteurella multocida]|uniref:DUF7210 family protein n=1 Tax=Pasteurella multocida TaxID=747 RepID=UPI0023014928|nr:hypothetical protein [Pasteurella multocida]MDA5607067.1 hypothetical protein [Pasteurella multocida subsp. multocida]MDA5614670.1 hypothetical protein [Pasteurella multocida]MDA5624607.1 hypothetical protein [Pasteurella multocida]